jgi:hypothetical protein
MCRTGGYGESETVTGKKLLGDSWEHTLATAASSERVLEDSGDGVVDTALTAALRDRGVAE